MRYPVLRSVDLLTFPDKIYFSSPTYSARNTRNEAEYVLHVGKVLTTDCISAATSGHAILDTVLTRTAAQIVHRTVQENKKIRNWPPTPQEIIENKDTCNPTTYNHIAWMVNPNTSLGAEGLAKLPKSKETKVLQIAQNIESLMTHSTPALDQLLLSLTLHRKTGSSDVVNTINAVWDMVYHILNYGLLRRNGYNGTRIRILVFQSILLKVCVPLMLLIILTGKTKPQVESRSIILTLF